MATIQCHCGSILTIDEIQETETSLLWSQVACEPCHLRIGIEGTAEELSCLVSPFVWSDEARYELERLPPYVAPLVREDVEAYARTIGRHLVTWALWGEARSRGTVVWTPEAERRLNNVPQAVRAMAKLELERAALDRGLSEVTVSLMEEIKARYFGLGAKPIIAGDQQHVF
ncbi:MAG: hypothetical protein D6690_00480 [Nitrospirae bacterium]|nr:MAG: hypothetical protein D6690_00480 [Nitrospirota bacterium]